MSSTLRIVGTRELVDHSGGSIVSVLAQPKRFALLCYLVLKGPYNAHSRDELVAMFWPELEEARARNALTQAVWFLRRALGAGCIENVGANELRIDPSAITCDATDFLARLDAGDDRGALDIYRGQLLPGFFFPNAEEFEPWVERERQRLHSKAIGAAKRLIESARKSGALADAIRFAERTVEMDTLSEVATRILMELHVEGGDRSKALAAYDTYATTLRLELDVAPSNSITSYRDEVRQVEVEMRLPAVVTPTTHVPAPVERSEHAAPTPSIVGARSFGRWSAVAPLLLTVLVATAWRLSSQPTTPVINAQVNIVLDDSVALRSDASGPLVSIDGAGQRIVYVGGRGTERLFIRDLNHTSPIAIAGTERARIPEFAPDGKTITFVRDGGVHVIPSTGGVSRKMLDSANRPTFGDDGSILFERPYGSLFPPVLYRVDKVGASIEQVTQLDSARGDLAHMWPHLFDNGKLALFEIVTGRADSSGLAVLRIADHTIKRLGVSGHHPRFVEPNKLVFSRRSGEIFSVDFDRTTLSTTGRPVRLLTNVAVKDGGATQLAFSGNGTMLYVPSESPRKLSLLDPATRTSRQLSERHAVSQPTLSPDQQFVAVTIATGGSTDVWIMDLANASMRQFTRDGSSRSPAWSADGRRVLWRSERNREPEMWSQDLQQTAAATHVLSGATSVSIAPNARFLIAGITARSAERIRGSSLLRYVALDEEGRPGQQRDLVDGARPRVSPDSRYVAFTSIDPLKNVFVRELVAPYRTLQVTRDGGNDAVWGTNNRLYIRRNGRIVAVLLDWGEQARVIDERVITDDTFWTGTNNSPNYDVMRDGRLLVIEDAGLGPQPVVEFNWARRKRPTAVPPSR